MPTAFAITAATTTVRLDAGEVQFTVTNTSGRPLRARLRAVALQPEAQGWFTVAGESERPFALGETQQITVRLAVPPPTPAGSYAVRLDAAAEDNPDDDSVQGPSVTVEVPPPPPKKPIPWWLLLAAVAVVVLLIGGGAAFFLLRDDGGTEVPDVAGQPVATARAALETAGLTVGDATPEVNPPNQVIRTDPAAGEKVDADEPVHLIVSILIPLTGEFFKTNSIVDLRESPEVEENNIVETLDAATEVRMTGKTAFDATTGTQWYEVIVVATRSRGWVQADYVGPSN